MNELIPTRSNHRIMTIIESAPLADSTKSKYRRVVDGYLASGGQLTDRAGLVAYAETLGNSRRAQLKAAIALWADATIEQIRGAATPEMLPQVDATIHRLTALKTAVSTKTTKGTKVHTWLTAVEVKAMLGAAGGDDIQAQRDRLALALQVGAGLRREEAVNLMFKDVKLQPVKGKIRSVLQIKGKGAKDRPVPISEELAGMIDAWSGAVGGDGFVLRSVDGGGLGQSLSAVGLFQIVRKYGRLIEKSKLAPHDLRRTYAQLGYEAGIPITQISGLLGHSSIATTQKYLNLELDLETTISDFIPLA